MHDDQFDIDEALVARLLADQQPELAELPIARVRSTGTVNALFRIGDDRCARLPLTEGWAESLRNELRWLPWLGERVSLRIPEPIFEGRPTSSYPFPWAIFRWIDGATYADERIADEREAAGSLATFVLGLRAIEVVGGAPHGGRDPLAELDVDTRRAIRASNGVIDRGAAMAAWDRALQAPAWEGRLTWIHSDLLRPNLLVAGGRLTAVIDFGGVGIGDPAADVIPAWAVFGSSGRAAYRAALDVDDGMWERARGYALHQAALIIPYYAETNPDFVTLAKRTVEEILADG
ncbi:MAG TPA: aminoglycoside phosphotransferase family protein [Actinomycetota bacterium]|nr:aminoglycoside phosphotransferase family protein [Actinomycetota bacterium]